MHFTTIDNVRAEILDDGLCLDTATNTLHFFIALPGAQQWSDKDIARAVYEREGPGVLAASRVAASALYLVVDRDVLHMEVDLDDMTLQVRVTSSAANIRKLSFEDVAQNLASETPCPHLIALRTLSKQLMDDRLQAGAMALVDQASGVYVPGDGTSYVSAGTSSDIAGEMIVQEITILMSSMLAKWCHERNVAVLYRSHGPVPEKEARNVKSQTARALINNDTKMLCKIREGVSHVVHRAAYVTSPARHEGLGLDYYMHVASPLRRAADVVNQLNILDYLTQRPLRIMPDTLYDIAHALNVATPAVLDVLDVTIGVVPPKAGRRGSPVLPLEVGDEDPDRQWSRLLDLELDTPGTFDQSNMLKLSVQRLTAPERKVGLWLHKMAWMATDVELRRLCYEHMGTIPGFYRTAWYRLNQLGVISVSPSQHQLAWARHLNMPLDDLTAAVAQTYTPDLSLLEGPACVSALNEWSQKFGYVEGPVVSHVHYQGDHLWRLVVSLGDEFARGVGSSKKRAQQTASLSLLIKLQKTEGTP